MTSASSPAEPAPLDPARHPAAIAAAIGAEWRSYRWRGYAVGFLAAVLASGVVAPLLTTSMIMVFALSGDAASTRIPWDAIVWSSVFALVAPWASATIFSRWQPRLFREATQTYLWLAESAEHSWARVFGALPVPRDERSTRELLASAAETPETAVERAGMWLALLELDRARAIAATIPETTPRGRFDRAATRWLADFTGGATPSLEPLERLAMLIPDGNDRLEVAGWIALGHARVALAEGRDWRTPLASIRKELGDAPLHIYRRIVWWPVFRRLLPMFALGTAAYWAAYFTLDPYFPMPGR